MKIVLLYTGQTQKKYMEGAISDYVGRIKHYVPFESEEISIPKKNQKIAAKNEVVKAEENGFMKHIRDDDYVILLDEKGKSFRSVEFAEYLQKIFLRGQKRMVFVIGGAWGVGKTVKARADLMVSLSKMTFSHQIVRIIFLEQLYRALTILKNEPYHNE